MSSLFSQKAKRNALIVYLVLLFVGRWLISSLWGAFALSLILYILAPSLGLSNPYNFAEMIEFIDGLGSEYKVAVLTSLITIVGFLIAFQTATKNWKEQMQTSLKMGIANEIETFFNEVSSLLTDANIYFSSLPETASLLSSSVSQAEKQFAIEYHIQQTEKFSVTRGRLSELTINVHRIQGKYGLVLSTVWNAVPIIEKAINAFGEITEKMWVPIPIIAEGDPNAATAFQAQLHINKWQEFTDAYEKNFDVINSMSGSVQGILLSELIGMPLPMIIRILKDPKMIDEFLEIRRKSR